MSAKMFSAVVVAVLLAITGCAAGTGAGTGAGTATGRAGPAATTPRAPATTATGPPASTGTRSPTAAPTRVPPPTVVSPSARPPTSRPPAAPPTPGPRVPACLLGADVQRLPTASKVVALTFDAGANGDAVASILATLAANGIHATFFLTGDFARLYPDKVRAIVAGGHRLGNHSINHPYFTDLTGAQIAAQLSGARNSIMAAGGTDPRPLFRFPYGDRDARTIAAVNANGYLPVRWTVDSHGWQGSSGGETVASVTSRVLAAAQPGEIVLMHVGSNPDDGTMLDAAALPGIISRLRALGYSFVTLDWLPRYC